MENIKRNPDNNQPGQAVNPLAPPAAEYRESSLRDTAQLAYELQLLHRAQSELIKTRDKYRDLFDTAPAGFFILDEQNIILDLNQTGARLLSNNKADLYHQSFIPFIPETGREIYLSQVTRAFEEYAQQDCDLEIARGDGSLFYAHMHILPLRDEKGEFTQHRVAVADISERRQSQEALRESEEKYHCLFENMSEGFALHRVISDAAGRLLDLQCVEVNRGFEKITGIKSEKYTSDTLLSLYPDISPVWLEHVAEVAVSGQPYHYECYSPLFQIWLEIHLFSPRSGFVANIFRNITRRKRMEEALARDRDELEKKVRERTTELAESEEKYRQLVENANEGITVFQDRFIRFCNNKTLELSGYSREELASKAFSELVHPEDRDQVIERYRRRLQGEEIPGSFEFRMIRKCGSISWVDINAVLITWEGRPAVMGISTDITARKRAEEALARAKTEVEQVNEQLRQYGRRITQVQEEERKRIAYELHDDTAQYLSILKLQLDSIINSGKIGSPEVLEKLRCLEQDAGRAVDGVCRYSHELRPGVLEHLGLLAALEQIAEDVNKLEHFKAVVEVEGAEQGLLEEVKLGFFRIAQEALNNCRKHARASRGIISLKFEEKRIRMTVRDNGHGFDVQEAATRSGLKGRLGLISMQERARLIGASLRIESEPGKGTRVIVEHKLDRTLS